MDAADADVKESVMIALLPTVTDWCRIELPHMTLVYAGIISELESTAFNDIAKDAAMIAALSSPITLNVIEQTRFGPNQDTEVFRLQSTPELMAMRRAVEEWNASEFDFNPHVTIGPAGTFVEFKPQALCFDRVLVAWGNDQLLFRMKYGVY